LSASIGSVGNNNDGTWSWSFNSSDGPAESQTVTIDADDGNGGTAQTSFQLTVNNVAPTVDAITVPTAPIDINAQPVNASATFSDPAGSKDEPYTCTVDYDDGSVPQAGTVSGGTCTGADQTYAEAGIYQVTVTVTDKDGATGNASATEFIVIYDPDVGYVMGNGWFRSPAGAYLTDPTLEDYAMFALFSRYKKGANVPTGSTKFLFMTADLFFRSSTYDWLVITGSNYAKFKGTGTVNGELAPNGEAYKFKIWARDDAPDTFRIKIWYEDGDDELVVYDNGLDQAIEGGDIVINKK